MSGLLDRKQRGVGGKREVDTGETERGIRAYTGRPMTILTEPG